MRTGLVLIARDAMFLPGARLDQLQRLHQRLLEGPVMRSGLELDAVDAALNPAAQCDQL